MRVMTPQHKKPNGRSIIERIFQIGTSWKNDDIQYDIVAVTNHQIIIDSNSELINQQRLTYLSTLLDIGTCLKNGGQLRLHRAGEWFIDLSSLHLLCKCPPLESKHSGEYLIIAKEDAL